MDFLSRLICHRFRGEYAASLPLCLRCSFFYTGMLLGTLFELALAFRFKARPTVKIIWVNVLCFLLVPLTTAYFLRQLMLEPNFVIASVGLWVGVSVSFFASTSLSSRFLKSKPVARPYWMLRIPFWLLLLCLPAAMSANVSWFDRLIGLTASAGVVVGPVVVSLAVFLTVKETMKRHLG